MLAAETVTLSLGAIQWIVGLLLIGFGGASGVLVAHAMQGRALTQLEDWKRDLVEAGFTAERWKEFRKWQSEASDDIEKILRDLHVQAVLEKEREKERDRQASSSSTTRGTQPYTRGRG